MANQFITTDLVSNTALAMFANNSPFVMTASRIYESDFMGSGYKIGDTISIRRQNHFTVGDGSVATPQSIIERVEQLVINHQYHALIAYTVKDLTLRIADFASQFIAPAIQEIITRMETDIATAAEQELYMFTGTNASPINSFARVDEAGAKLLEMGVNIRDNAYLAVSVRDGASLKNSLLQNFTPVYNEDIVRTSAIGHLSYFDVFQSQSIRRHTAGAGPRLYSSDILLVNGAVSSGNTIILDGATASINGYFVPGDVISIAGVQSVNPVGRASTGQNMQFVVQNTANSTAGGAVVIQVSPTINSDVNDPNRNVSNPIPDNAQVIMVGSHNVNVAYPERGLDIVVPPLYKLEVTNATVAIDETTGLSLAVTSIGDITSYQNYMRIDVLCGFKWHPEYAVRVVSQLQ